MKHEFGELREDEDSKWISPREFPFKCYYERVVGRKLIRGNDFLDVVSRERFEIEGMIDKFDSGFITNRPNGTIRCNADIITNGLPRQLVSKIATFVVKVFKDGGLFMATLDDIVKTAVPVPRDAKGNDRPSVAVPNSIFKFYGKYSLEDAAKAKAEFEQYTKSHVA